MIVGSNPVQITDDTRGAQLTTWPPPVYSRLSAKFDLIIDSRPTRDTTFFLSVRFPSCRTVAPNGLFSVAMMLAAFGYIKGIQ